MIRERHRRTNEQEARHRQAELQFARVIEPVAPQANRWFSKNVNTALHRQRQESWRTFYFDLDGNYLGDHFYDDAVEKVFRTEEILENEGKALTEALGLYELLQRYPGIGSTLELAREGLVRTNPRLRDCLIVLTDRAAEPQVLLEWLSRRHKDSLPGSGQHLGELKATMTQACGLVIDAYVTRNLGPILGVGFRPPILR